MIGFELPYLMEDAPVCWKNFAKSVRGLTFTEPLVEFRAVLHKRGLLQTEVGYDHRINNMGGFLEFETEADMLYFKMRWS